MQIKSPSYRKFIAPPPPDLATNVNELVKLVFELNSFKTQFIKTINDKMAEIDDVIAKVKEIKPEKGEKGKDADNEYIIKQLFSMIEIPKPKDGQDGKNADEEKIIKEVLAKIKLPKDGKDAFIDYEKIYKAIEKKLPQETDPMKIVDLIMGLPEEKKKFGLKIGHIDGLEQTISAFRNQLARGYLHGGGMTLKEGTNITITKNSDGTHTVSSTGAGMNVLEPTGDIDDSNKDFVFASKPTLISVNGTTYRENHGWSWNAGILTATLDNPVGIDGDIYGLG